MNPTITVEVLVCAPVEKVWQCWTKPEHIINWCFASDDWCAPRAENDVRVGGIFTTRMEAKDGSVGFDFSGTYTVVENQKKLAYVMTGKEARKVQIDFAEQSAGCRVMETFDPEDENSLEMQRHGWQAILENFKKYTESV